MNYFIINPNGPSHESTLDLEVYTNNRPTIFIKSCSCHPACVLLMRTAKITRADIKERTGRWTWRKLPGSQSKLNCARSILFISSLHNLLPFYCNPESVDIDVCLRWLIIITEASLFFMLPVSASGVLPTLKLLLLFFLTVWRQ